MAYLNFSEGLTGKNTKSKNPAILGRVYDVVVNESHPLYKKVPLGTIRFQYFDEDYFDTPGSLLHVAFPLDSSIHCIPLVNEIVNIHQGPDDSLERTDSEKKVYYSNTISVWDAVNHNAAPINTTSPTAVYLGPNVVEIPKINNLHKNIGDITIDSRFGSSLRFSGYSGSLNSYTDETNNGKPFTILSNGRTFNGDNLDYTVENINLDSSSIYLTSDHSVPLVEPDGKLIPESKVDQHTIASSYKGAQILLNSNRLFFNARQDDIVLTANESITGIAQNINLDGKDYVSIDGEKIYLGKEPKNATNTQGAESLPDPAILGDRLEVFLDDLLTEIKMLATALENNIVVGLKNVPLVAAGKNLNQGIIELKKQITPLKNNGTSRLKSTKVFVGEGKDFKKDRSI